MEHRRGPHYSSKCPFHIDPAHPLTAKKSIARCVKCVTCGNHRLEQMKTDLQQIAYLTVLESSPQYDPDHQTGASYTTFIRSRVCTKLWNERKKHLQSIPFCAIDEAQEDQQFAANPLVDGLTTEACQCESIDEAVVRQVDVERFKTLLPQLLSCLSEKEGLVLKLRFFEERKAVEVAKQLGISQGRVSQLFRSALTKLKKLYLFGAIGS
ncbi:sigma-70 family RNA polymerase sigma factor [Candidatus Poribacteria bacterium]|nr:sigma-70 family RNA polymerase sigma factor [Candidatus Poribacteria bacterium]